MSQLQKKIARTQRREGGSIGFGPTTREQPRAMLLAAIAADAASGKAAVEAGADVVILRGDAEASLAAIKALAEAKATAGVWSDALSESAAEALAKAGCDFVISTLEGTASAAVDTERMGQLIVASEAMDDSTLRSFGPLGLDGLFVQATPGAMTLAQQLALVRFATFASSQLMVAIEPSATVNELRVLRDSGATSVVLTNPNADDVKRVNDALKAVPAPRRGKENGREIALVPSVASRHEEEDDDGEEDE
jgi:2-keto-3-deoxy-L-rhamnonate aldolase RhmA